MMKTRFLMLAMVMCMTALTFSACNDDDDDKSIDVPEAVTQALKQKYPNATDVDWTAPGTSFQYISDSVIHQFPLASNHISESFPFSQQSATKYELFCFQSTSVAFGSIGFLVITLTSETLSHLKKLE